MRNETFHFNIKKHFLKLFIETLNWFSCSTFNWAFWTLINFYGYFYIFWLFPGRRMSGYKRLCGLWTLWIFITIEYKYSSKTLYLITRCQFFIIDLRQLRQNSECWYIIIIDIKFHFSYRKIINFYLIILFIQENLKNHSPFLYDKNPDYDLDIRQYS